MTVAIDLDLINGMVNFGMLCFCMGKCLNSGFLRNLLSLRYNIWYIWLTKLPDEKIIRSRSKSFFDLYSRTLRFCLLSTFSEICSEATGPIESIFHIELHRAKRRQSLFRVSKGSKIYLSCDTTKPTMWLCALLRLRSAWASAKF